MLKIGDKGKTRDGRNYEVVWVDASLNKACQVTAKVEGASYLYTYYADGKTGTCEENETDLMPPSETKWFALLVNKAGTNFCAVADSESILNGRVSQLTSSELWTLVDKFSREIEVKQ